MKNFFKFLGKLLPVLPQEVDSLQITVQSLSVNLPVTYRCCHRNLAELFSARNIGNMNLHLGNINACQIIPDGTFPELLRFGPQKEYLRKVLKTTILNTAVQDDPAIPVETLTKDAPYYAYQAAVCPDAARVASHQVIEEHIGTSGKDYRFEERPHPVEALRDRTQDNTTIARGKI